MLNRFIEKSISVHGLRYDYSLVEYKRAIDKIIIICAKHGQFLQTPHDHLSGRGCKLCGIENSTNLLTKTLDEFIADSRSVHGEKYDYSLVEYSGDKAKVKIICKQHGEFYQTPSNHIFGFGCKLCGLQKSTTLCSKLADEFIADSKVIHGEKYDYSFVEYRNSKTKVKIICKQHGIFNQTPSNHLNGQGCRQCGEKIVRLACVKTKSQFIADSMVVHDGRYDYSLVEYGGDKAKVKIICHKHGEFCQRPNNHLNGAGCPKCSGTHLQEDVYNFVKQHVECDYNNRVAIKPHELDIYIQSLQLGIEINGLYYHSYGKLETNNERNAHSVKLEKCISNQIRLLQFNEYEWNNKREICKSIILNKLGKSEKIFARKCELFTPTNEEYKKFLEENHIQGTKGCSYKIGLKYEHKFVSVMSFNKHNLYGWEISRLSTKLNLIVVGGASRLFKKFLSDINPKQVMTYSDRRFGDGDVYKKLGFLLVGVTGPNYCYLKQKNIFSRQKFQKHKQHKILKMFDDSLTEYQNMFNNGYRRMWDAGHNKFLWSKQ